MQADVESLTFSFFNSKEDLNEGQPTRSDSPEFDPSSTAPTPASPTKSIPHSPLEVKLPALPSPSISRSTSVTHHRSSTGMTTSGLDLTSTPQRYQPRFGPGSSSITDSGLDSLTGQNMSDSTWRGGNDADSLEEDGYQARQARLSRPTPFSHSSSNDTASARENIMNLASRGRAPTGSGPVASLASFMGGGARPPPLHRVGTGPTEQEQEETERLEKEMAATRARFGTKADNEVKKGPSLAELIGGRPGASSSPVAKRWTPAEPVKANSAPTPYSSTADTSSRPFPLSRTTSDRPTSFSSSPQPQSLAAMMGSRAAGPRLNQPQAQAAVEEGPAHARPQSGGSGVAMPGMVAAGIVRSRRESYTNLAAAASAPSPPSPAVVEAKVVTRVPPPAGTTPSLPTSSTTPTSDSATFEAKVVSRSPPDSFGGPSIPQTSTTIPSSSSSDVFAPKMVPTASLTKLQSSNIVADRLRWSQEKEESKDVSAPGSPETSPSKAANQAKRRSVIERWGRDEPNVVGAAPSSPSKSSTSEEKSLTGIRGGEFSKGLNALPRSGPALSNATRAKPPRSTPSTTTATPSSSLPATDSALPPSSSPSLDDTSASTESKTWTETNLSEEPQSNAPRSWTSPPISVKPTPTSSRQTSWLTREEAPERKSSPGVALPGMSAPKMPSSDDPTMSRLIASQYETSRGLQDIESSARFKEPERPTAMEVASSISSAPTEKPIAFPAATNPWNSKDPARPITPPPSTRARPTSISISRLAKDELVAEGPRSPGGSLVRNKIAAWGTSSSNPPSRTPSRSASIDITNRPGLDVGGGLKRRTSTPFLASGQTSATAVLALESSSDSPVEVDYGGVLYETETVAIVHRSHGTSAAVWVWVGDASKYETEKGAAFQSLAGQYRVDPTIVRQGTEPQELLAVLVAPLIVRKGRRSDYDKEQSRLYRVEARIESKLPGSRGVVIDERQLVASSLCSGFCSVVATNGDVYVWTGKGSLANERKVAESFASEIAEGRPLTVAFEGKEPSHFWYSLGDKQEYASASHWRFRPTVAYRYPTTIDLASTRTTTRQNILNPISDSSITLIDAGLEKVILVPQGTSDRKAEIEVALDAATETSLRWKTRGLPFRPPIHVLIFPTLVPLDYLHLTGCADLTKLNLGTHPSRMQLYDAKEAREKLL